MANGAQDDPHFRKDLQSTLRESSTGMEDDVFNSLCEDMHIIVCGSPRVGKSTLINAICGREVADAKEGLDSVTQTITSYTMEGQCDTGSKSIPYKYTIWDTPGFESWEKHDIRSKVKEIIDKPKAKPVCMIFCAAPSTFVDLKQLEWLLDLCINVKHIFCALVCTNKYAGQVKSRRAVLDDFNRLLSQYVTDQPRIEKEIAFYGNIGLCTCVNSEPFDQDDRTLPTCGIDELIYGIMESLIDEQVLNWCLIVLENKGFWKKWQERFKGYPDGFKNKKDAFKKLFNQLIHEKAKSKKRLALLVD